MNKPLKKNEQETTVLRQRQVHLDFHTSPHISDVGSEFDADYIAQQFEAAYVDSVTVFAKCHHGMCYYPTKTGTSHPAIGSRDLLGELIEALHRKGIKAPIYTTVAWEEDVADRFPAWRQMLRDGTFARAHNADHTKEAHPGGWRFMDWSHPEYQDYIESHVRELVDLYPIDGLFFDILFYKKYAHYSDTAMKLRHRWGLEGDGEAAFRRFEIKAQRAFCRRFSSLAQELVPNATVFYNAGLEVSTETAASSRVRYRHMTHFEVESLPSGFWGYYHFPRSARSIAHWGKPWLGMTGRFQRMWGDFGGIKPTAALEYECFRTQALGGGNSVGDQLPPRGQLDQAALRLIGDVYRQCAEAEPFYSGSEPCFQVGVLTASHPGRDPDDALRSDEGAVQMLEESHYEAVVLDGQSSFKGLDLIVLPDCTVVSELMRQKLMRYYQSGGKLIVSHHAGRDPSGKWMLDFLPLDIVGEGELFPTYWRCRTSFWPEMTSSDRVVYSQGVNVNAGEDTEVLVDRVLPYFNRTDLKFSSHFQTPPVRRSGKYPAVVAGTGFVYFSDPVFREYRQVGNTALRDVLLRVMHRVVGEPPVGAGLPTTMQCVTRRKGNDLLITLLHYVPLRKSLELDVLEERMSFAGEELRFTQPVEQVRMFGADSSLDRLNESCFVLPVAKGRLLLEVPDFFET
ncbi:alpha-L-fucosidase [Pelagicoccus mobilis]|uniref:Alpha-L-fucosidase n=1 Tax=Pelagicoccus mobilis TaxID=415221 RepID=A0A934RXE4_9BACT|nr:alpha-L-fucosidase [Pelagicoccus mobilis]MBK1876117.1 alpha-L-fucosidase [Pelagicoccus mobilis]